MSQQCIASIQLHTISINITIFSARQMQLKTFDVGEMEQKCIEIVQARTDFLDISLRSRLFKQIHIHSHQCIVPLSGYTTTTKTTIFDSKK